MLEEPVTNEPTPDAVRIVIVDDHPLFLEGVAATLSSEPDMEVVGEGGSAADALRLATTLLPDVLLLDVTMPGGGLEAAQAVAAACPVTKIVMLTFSEAEDDVLTALKHGARGYVLKGVTSGELKAHVRAVHAGEVSMTPSLAAGLLFELTTGAARAKAGQGDPAPTAGRDLEHDPVDDLTRREQQILELVAAGKSNKEVGRTLSITEKTVKHYMSNILQKLQVRNRVEAALLAQRRQGR